jgi:uncharacterized Zn finger protein (UPF0148 family)
MGGMFDKTLRELERMKRGISVSVPIDSDEKGYVDKECPNSECLYVFKTNQEDWKDLFRDEAVFCPRCGHEAPAQSWFTTEQVEHAQGVAVQQLKGQLGAALRDDARSFNARQPRGGLIKMSMSYSGPTSEGYVLPASARELLEQELQCDECKARFAVLGCAFFCPCCGHNSVERTFDAALDKVLANLDALALVRQALDAAGLKDQAETTAISLVESSLQDCVTAFQTLCAGLFSRVAPGVTAPPNVFQRIEDGSDLWTREKGIAYSDFLSTAELQRLGVHFQRRHLLAHSLGLVDEKYVRKTGDPVWRVGQRLVISPADVRDCVALIRKLTLGLRARLTGPTSPSASAP